MTFAEIGEVLGISNSATVQAIEARALAKLRVLAERQPEIREWMHELARIRETVGPLVDVIDGPDTNSRDEQP